MTRHMTYPAWAALLFVACRSVQSMNPPYTPDDYVHPASSGPGAGSVVLTPEALQLHHSSLVFDGHNDLPGEIRQKGRSSFDLLDIAQAQPQLHTDIERLRRGGVGAQFWSAYVPTSTMQTGGAARYALEQIDLIHRMVRRYPDVFEMAYTADDIVRIRRKGRIASLIGVEGGHAIENSLGVLRMFYALGVRYLTLTHTKTIDWADSCTDEPRHGGLTDFGEQVVREMNRLGMLVDISHVSADAMRHAIRVSKAPVIASHSSAYALAPHPRNVPDDVLRMVADNGGVVMVNFFSGFVDPAAARRLPEMYARARALQAEHTDEAEARKAVEAYIAANPLPRGTVQTVVDHIDHAVAVAGIDHVGLGSDFDGVTSLPEQLDDVAHFPFITQELLNRGYRPGEIRKILGENAVRALREAEMLATGL